ncbi:MAG TPA: calcium-binding protein [Solirubrobacteraceae bacterium]|nr:calcium-binding protein [Solirubrobacteraceae bacterium]
MTAGSAHAAVVLGDRDLVTYHGARGQPTSLTVTTVPGGGLTLRDEGQALQARGACRAVGVEVHCPRTRKLSIATSTRDDRVTIDAAVKSISRLDAGNDHLLGSQGPDGSDGGPGNDTLEGRGGDDGQDVDPSGGSSSEDRFEGGRGADVVDGGPGDDKLAGDELGAGAGADTLLGGPGDDLLDGNGASDAMSGGDGRDRVTYTTYRPVTADLDGQADDGAPGENDRIAADVEDLEGGVGADRLTGDEGPNRLSSGDGVDCHGEEEIQCGPPGPTDVLDGRGGNDVLDGGSSGRDRLLGGDGDDVLNGQEQALNVDARDTLDCGAGVDTAYHGNSGWEVFDRNGDRLGANCERRRRAGAGPATRVTGPRSARRVAGRLHVRVRCPSDPPRFEAAGCDSHLVVYAPGSRRSLGEAFPTLRANETRVLSVGLSRHGRAAAIPGRRVRVAVRTFVGRRAPVRSAVLTVRR